MSVYPTITLILFHTQAMANGSRIETTLETEVLALLQPVITLFSKNPWIKGGLVIIITIVFASFITWLLFSLLRRLARVTKIEFDDQAITLLRPPVYFSLLAIGFLAGFQLMPLPDKTATIVTRCIHSFGVIIWVYFFTRLATLLLQRVANLSDRYQFVQNRTLTLFDNGAKIFIFGLGTYAFFVIWNIDMTAWLASAGIVGIAIGFAAKDTLSNLFSGVFILADVPYKVGDYIVLDRGDRGKVTHIGLRSTRILTRDDIEITVPNSIIGNTTIINQSGGRHRKMRIRLKIGVAYGSDIDQVRGILIDIAANEPLVCTTPAPRVRFRVFGASSLDFELLCWVNDPELRGRTMDRLNDTVYKKFQQENIEIPYSKQDLYIKGLPHQVLLSETETNVDNIR